MITSLNGYYEHLEWIENQYSVTTILHRQTNQQTEKMGNRSVVRSFVCLSVWSSFLTFNNDVSAAKHFFRFTKCGLISSRHNNNNNNDDSNDHGNVVDDDNSGSIHSYHGPHGWCASSVRCSNGMDRPETKGPQDLPHPRGPLAAGLSIPSRAPTGTETCAQGCVDPEEVVVMVMVMMMMMVVAIILLHLFVLFESVALFLSLSQPLNLSHFPTLSVVCL